MKKKHLLLFAIVSMAMFMSCSENEETVEPIVEPMLQLTSASTLSVPVETSQHFISFICSVPWTATIDVPWCSISPNQGKGSSVSQTKITASVGANPIAAERTANITIQAGSLSKIITLTQAAGNAELSISPTFITVKGENEYSITVTSNAQWTAAVNDATFNSWCTITPNTGFGNGTITVSVAKNHSYARRHALISVISDGIQKTDTIFQIDGEVYSDPNIGVAINGITWAARNVNNFGTFTDFATESGKYYQFNRAVGYSYIGGNIEQDGSHNDIVGGSVEPAFATEYAYENRDWELFNDPCPCGWRLPTDVELEDLRKSGYRWVNDPAGAWLGQDASTATFALPGKAIFLPANGLLFADKIHYVGEGAYYTKTQVWIAGVADSGRFLSFTQSGSNGVTGRFIGKRCALSIRCIKE